MVKHQIVIEIVAEPIIHRTMKSAWNAGDVVRLQRLEDLVEEVKLLPGVLKEYTITPEWCTGTATCPSTKYFAWQAIRSATGQCAKVVKEYLETIEEQYPGALLRVHMHEEVVQRVWI